MRTGRMIGRIALVAGLVLAALPAHIASAAAIQPDAGQCGTEGGIGYSYFAVECAGYPGESYYAWAACANLVRVKGPVQSGTSGRYSFADCMKVGSWVSHFGYYLY